MQWRKDVYCGGSEGSWHGGYTLSDADWDAVLVAGFIPLGEWLLCHIYEAVASAGFREPDEDETEEVRFSWGMLPETKEDEEHLANVLNPPTQAELEAYKVALEIRNRAMG